MTSRRVQKRAESARRRDVCRACGPQVRPRLIHTRATLLLVVLLDSGGCGSPEPSYSENPPRQVDQSVLVIEKTTGEERAVLESVYRANRDRFVIRGDQLVTVRPIAGGSSIEMEAALAIDNPAYVRVTPEERTDITRRHVENARFDNGTERITMFGRGLLSGLTLNLAELLSRADETELEREEEEAKRRIHRTAFWLGRGVGFVVLLLAIVGSVWRRRGHKPRAAAKAQSQDCVASEDDSQEAPKNGTA